MNGRGRTSGQSFRKSNRGYSVANNAIKIGLEGFGHRKTRAIGQSIRIRTLGKVKHDHLPTFLTAAKARVIGDGEKILPPPSLELFSKPLHDTLNDTWRVAKRMITG